MSIFDIQVDFDIDEYLETFPTVKRETVEDYVRQMWSSTSYGGHGQVGKIVFAKPQPKPSPEEVQQTKEAKMITEMPAKLPREWLWVKADYEEYKNLPTRGTMLAKAQADSKTYPIKKGDLVTIQKVLDGQLPRALPSKTISR